jgi:hypothetical protein
MQNAADRSSWRCDVIRGHGYPLRAQGGPARLHVRATLDRVSKGRCWSNSMFPTGWRRRRSFLACGGCRELVWRQYWTARAAHQVRLPIKAQQDTVALKANAPSLAELVSGNAELHLAAGESGTGDMLRALSPEAVESLARLRNDVWPTNAFPVWAPAGKSTRMLSLATAGQLGGGRPYEVVLTLDRAQDMRVLRELLLTAASLFCALSTGARRWMNSTCRRCSNASNGGQFPGPGPGRHRAGPGHRAGHHGAAWWLRAGRCKGDRRARGFSAVQPAPSTDNEFVMCGPSSLQGWPHYSRIVTATHSA